MKKKISARGLVLAAATASLLLSFSYSTVVSARDAAPVEDNRCPDCQGAVCTMASSGAQQCQNYYNPTKGLWCEESGGHCGPT